MTTNNEPDNLVRFRQMCRRHGFRVTHQKVMIYQELLNSEDHPTPEKLFNRLSPVVHGLSLDTVYRTLAAFQEMGLVNEVEGYGNAKRFDSKLEKHHHLHCIKCGTIVDFTSDSYDAIEVPKNISKGFKIKLLRVTIDGFCKKCLNKTN